MEIDDTGLAINLPMERPLYRRTQHALLESQAMEQGISDFDSSAMLNQLFIDRDLLAQRVLRSLGRHDQVSLSDVITSDPLEQGLAELVGYMSLNEPGFSVIFDDDRRERIEWSTADVQRVADLPRVNFSRDRSESQ
jgi:hypothetical protein